MGTELVSMKDGADHDAHLHAELLDNVEAEKAIASAAIDRAIRDGMSRDDAVHLYGYRGVIKYNPNEAREQAGTPTGGRWTSGGASGLDNADIDRFVKEWADDADWEGLQHAARAVIAGTPRDQYVCYDCRGDDGERYDRAQAMLDLVESQPIDKTLYRGILTKTDYKVGDKFSESFASWTGNKDLAAEFASGRYAAPWGKTTLPVILGLVSASGMKGIHVSDRLPESASTVLKTADEYLASGQYEVVRVSAPVAGKPSEVLVRRVGPAHTNDLKKVIKYNPDEARAPKGSSIGGRWTGSAVDDGLFPAERMYWFVPDTHPFHDLITQEQIRAMFAEFKDVPKGFLRVDGSYSDQIAVSFSDGVMGDDPYEIRRNFTGSPKALTVRHDFFKLPKSQQGLDVAKRFLGDSMATYQDMGIKQIDLNANNDVGGYAWAKYGFTPASNYTHYRSYVRQRLGKIKNGIISQTLRDHIESLSASEDPKSVWGISDLSQHYKGNTLGKYLLMGSNWEAVLKLNDKAAMKRFNAYIGKRGVKK
jgi:hypothetical protein